MTPKLAWTALTRQPHVLHPNELEKGHLSHTERHTQSGKTCRIVLINACIHSYKFTNGSGTLEHKHHMHNARAAHLHVHKCVNESSMSRGEQ